MSAPTDSTSDPHSSRDRAIGALVGLAAGDAVGLTVEFQPPGSFTPLTDMVGGGPFSLPVGAWTDDTSLAMCLAESILDTGELDVADQLRRYVQWWRHGYWSSTGECFDIGTTTVAGLRRFETTGAVTDPVVDDRRAANGSLMRLAPVPIRWHRDIAEAAERSGESSRTTHAAARPVDTCRVYGAMIAALISGADIDDVLHPDFWQWGQLHPEVEAVACGTWRHRQPPEIRGSGFCVEALEAAIWAVAGADSFSDAALRAANLGDDADTTAAIAGQLAGARWGASGIPQHWRNLLVSGDRIEAIARRLWEQANGQRPPAVWQHDQFLHAWWTGQPDVLAGEYPGHIYPDRARDKVNLLLDHGIRTFIDLTEPADGLAPYANELHRSAGVRRLDVRYRRHPIPDMGVVDLDTYTQIVNEISDATSRGGVYVHCWGGMGRTGTVIGCLLGNRLDYTDVVEQLAQQRLDSRKAHIVVPVTGAQRDVIRAWVERRTSS